MNKPCYMCLNARVDDELTDHNDFSSFGIGKSCNGYSMFINSGNGVPVNIEVMAWNEKVQRNVTVAKYFPKYCPNCGRQLNEYEVAGRRKKDERL